MTGRWFLGSGLAAGFPRLDVRELPTGAARGEAHRLGEFASLRPTPLGRPMDVVTGGQLDVGEICVCHCGALQKIALGCKLSRLIWVSGASDPAFSPPPQAAFRPHFLGLFCPSPQQVDEDAMRPAYCAANCTAHGGAGCRPKKKHLGKKRQNPRHRLIESSRRKRSIFA